MNYIPAGNDLRAMLMAHTASKAALSQSEVQQLVDYIAKYGVERTLAAQYISNLTYRDLDEIIREKAFRVPMPQY